MLEIPESCTISSQLNEVIKNKTIMNVYANSSPHAFAWYFGNPEEYQNLLHGKTIERAVPMGGQIEISAQDTKILLAEGVNIRYLGAGEKLPKKHQLLIEFTDFSSLVCTVAMYGGMWAFKDGENQNPYYLVSKEKPSPLTEEFNEAYFESLLDMGMTGKLSAKAFVATEQRIPGLGNGTLQDILWHASIHPKRKMSTLSPDEMKRLYHSIKSILAEMTAKGGRDTERDLFGCYGGYVTKCSKKTFGMSCPSCGHDIIKEAYLGGSIYYCGVCQPR